MAYSAASNDLFAWISDEINHESKNKTKSISKSTVRIKTNSNRTINDMISTQYNANNNAQSAVSSTTSHSVFGIDLDPNPKPSSYQQQTTATEPEKSVFNIDLNPQPTPITSTTLPFNNNTSDMAINNNPTHLNVGSTQNNMDLNYVYNWDNTSSSKTEQPMDLNFLFAEDTTTTKKSITNKSTTTTPNAVHKHNDEEHDDAKYIDDNETTSRVNALRLKMADGFDANIFRAISSVNKSKNIILSPLSILSAMTFAMAGAKGITMKEMLKVLHPLSDDKSHALRKTMDNIKYLMTKYGQKKKVINHL